MSSNEANISSAEMTAYWRSLFPQFSHDEISIKLASPAGIEKSKEFEKRFDYPLIGRKVSVRAGFILQNAIRLLATGKYDSCISLASGFSLLTYCIAAGLSERSAHIHFFDSDLPHMAEERAKRINALPSGLLSPSVSNKIKIVPADLEAACRAGTSLKDLFPGCKRPLFIIEGVIYFLSAECVKWLIAEISSYDNAAVIFDYWPEDGVTYSNCFKRVVDSLKGYIPENIKSFWGNENIQELSTRFPALEDHKIGDIENRMSIENGEVAQFNNQHTFFPVKFIIAER
jgi:O-methyltransferase involved in polyketide biosynthesis